MESTEYIIYGHDFDFLIFYGQVEQHWISILKCIFINFIESSENHLISSALFFILGHLLLLS